MALNSVGHRDANRARIRQAWDKVTPFDASLLISSVLVNPYLASHTRIAG